MISALNDPRFTKRLWLINDSLLVQDFLQPFSVAVEGLVELLQLTLNDLLLDSDYLLIIASSPLSPSGIEDNGFSLLSMRELLLTTNSTHHQALVRAYHRLNWHKQSQFCGQCASPLSGELDSTERHCEQCEQSFFPRFSPAMMVLIKKGDQLLLAHSARHKKGVYSALAGFVEPGETIEQCVHREVMEEVGLSVKNLRYYASQPWPFPDCLMVAYLADYDSGEIRLDDDEISDAGWFCKDTLPKLPNSASIARQLIEYGLSESTH